MKDGVPSNTSAASAIHLLHRAGQCADDLFSAEIDGSQLTPRQYIVLKSAAVAGEASQTALVEATGIDRSTVADIVRRLVERGLLQRERTKHDARMYAVSITPSGQAALDQADPTRQMCENRLLEAVPMRDRDAFVRSLQSIIDTFGPISSAQVKPRRDVPGDGQPSPQ
ncbi:MAG: MarR family winged helix-turn-helix transcriptional regulator [Pseudomonadota bacterium]